MITKIFKSEFEEHEVKQNVRKEIEVEYEEEIETSEDVLSNPNNVEGYCGRCGKNYKYGDNSKNPELCPNCVCVTCKKSIMERYRTAFHGETKITKCYSCWYKSYHGRNYYGNITGYEIAYNHKKAEAPIYVKQLKKEKVKKVRLESQIVEEIVKVKEEIRNLYNPSPIVYDFSNDIIFNELTDLKTIINSSKFIEAFEENIKDDVDWYNAKSLCNARSRMYASFDKEYIKIKELTELYVEEEIVDEHQKLKEFLDVVGFYPNVPAYIQGFPLDMYNNQRQNERTIIKKVDLYINLAVDSKCDLTHYRNRGVITYNLIKFLQQQKVSVGLTLIDATFIDGQALVQKIYVSNEDIINNDALLYNALTDISFYRVFILGQKISQKESLGLNDAWNSGYGYIIKTNELRKILNIGSEKVIIGDPEELGIKGYDSVDDYVNAFKRMKLYNDNIFDFFEYEKEVEIATVSDVLKRRNISNLVHITATDNIESIKEKGLLTLKSLTNNQIKYIMNDFQRNDSSDGPLCLSVTKPNKFLLDAFIKKYPGRKYSIIEIDPSILTAAQSNIEFFDYNAASHFSKKSDNMNIMFKDKIRKRGITLVRKEHLDDEPTSIQAEILYYNDIEPKYIKKIVSADDYYAKRIVVQNGNKIEAIKTTNNTKSTFYIDVKKYPLQSIIIGKSIGDLFVIQDVEYKITVIGG